jgi:hypothetical protein
MSQKPISELRRRMLEDMAVRKFSETTCRNYIRHSRVGTIAPAGATTSDVPTILRATPGSVIAMRNGGVTAMRTSMFLMPVE